MLYFGFFHIEKDSFSIVRLQHTFLKVTNLLSKDSGNISIFSFNGNGFVEGERES